MSYDPTTWKSGDVVTSAKLNKMEKGIEDANAGGSGGGATVVNVTETESGQDYVYTCDKTAEEILTALEIGAVVFKYDYGYIETCLGGGHVLDSYQFVRGGTDLGATPFTATELTDYPSYVD